MKRNWAAELRKALKRAKPITKQEYEKRITILCKEVIKRHVV